MWGEAQRDRDNELSANLVFAMLEAILNVWPECNGEHPRNYEERCDSQQQEYEQLQPMWAAASNILYVGEAEWDAKEPQDNDSEPQSECPLREFERKTPSQQQAYADGQEENVKSVTVLSRLK